MIEAWTKTLPLTDLLALLEANGVPAAEVRDPRTAVSDPLVVQRGETVRLTHPKFGEVADAFGIGMPIRFSAASTGYDLVTPEMGEHNQLVYGGMLGYSAKRIEALKAEGVI